MKYRQYAYIPQIDIYIYQCVVCFTISDSTEIDQAAFDAKVNFSKPHNRSIRPKGYQNSTMWEQTRYILYTFYKPFNQALANLLKDPKFDYGPY